LKITDAVVVYEFLKLFFCEKYFDIVKCSYEFGRMYLTFTQSILIFKECFCAD